MAFVFLHTGLAKAKHSLTALRQARQNPNPNSLSLGLFGYFPRFFFAWRQPSGIKCKQTISKIPARIKLSEFGSCRAEGSCCYCRRRAYISLCSIGQFAPLSLILAILKGSNTSSITAFDNYQSKQNQTKLTAAHPFGAMLHHKM